MNKIVYLRIMNIEKVMEEIRIFVENIIGLCGLSGCVVPVVRHVALVIIAVLLAWLSGVLCRRLLVPLVEKLTAKTEAKWDDVLFNRKVLLSACHIVPAIIIWELLPMVFYQFPFVMEILKRVTAVYITVMSVRLTTVFITSFQRMETSASSSTQQYMQSFCGVLKILIFFVAAIIVVAIILGKSPFTLLAGLGATSAILMLVFKDTLEGLVAGVRLTSNDMVHKGDWITVPAANADGTVEDISLSTVKIRNFDNTIITVSPKTLAEGSFQNWKGMQEKAGRRMARTVYFDYHSICVATDDLKNKLQEKKYFSEDELDGEWINMSLYRKFIERYLKSRDDVLEQETLMVRQLKGTDTGLPLEIYCFMEQKEWVSFEHHSADIMEHVYAYAQDFGLVIYERAIR